MEIKTSHLVIIVIALFAISVGISYSYFGANIIPNNVKETKVTTGKIELEIDDVSITAEDIAPIYDEDYEMLGIHKNFAVTSTNSNLNACTKIYLDIDSITDNLKSEYFKYKLIFDGYEKYGNFVNAMTGNKMLIDENIFIESGKTKMFDLYIWVSYQEGVDQTNMLGGSVKTHLYIEGLDVKEESICR
ncbi:MAG: hypothetical protein IKR57_03705 [Bacilli bacterium]|nr:hypothetical protein [Bacilli bacterium]